MNALDRAFVAVPRYCLQYLEELDSVMGSERLSLEAMRGKFIDEYAKAVAENVAAGLGPPPGRQQQQQQQQHAAAQGP